MAVKGAGSRQGSIFRGRGRDGRERVESGALSCERGPSGTTGWGGARPERQACKAVRAAVKSYRELEEGGQALAPPWAWWACSWTCTHRCSASLLEGLC